MHRTATTTPPVTQLAGLIKLMRPRQWIKNAFVLAPLIFSGEFVRLESVGASLRAMLLFCIASSLTYVFNDICDVERDRRHPVKSRTRPLASGKVPMSWAIALASVLLGVLIIGSLAAPACSLVIAAYLLLNIAYSVVLKHQPVVDIFTIAIGFVLRVVAGAVALHVPVSSWMFITTLCLALYLASIKRRQELGSNGTGGRKVLDAYSISLIDRYAGLSAMGALLFYSLYVLSARPALAATVPLVLFGLFRYWFLVESQNDGESPTEALLGDWQLLATVAVWTVACLWALWPRVGLP
ncbi:decaprenyl-phosphate phosphoribosyltransferase [Pseudoxanthomonas indica]|uniref:4-hydroxybenzoate polyprenyltransferase n=1 Tax=Pseudoxanthomonas indica TaxID=428993 RepID=A0A1T5LWU8_9GAMM|nr:decaprenyl-phosphate phosphoribosyltransferase [Pseudoxanthomonas indica]SKC80476.1 4-hydroxybenzoate polyprenyltransferase [Pseudoxanthomonas indica]